MPIRFDPSSGASTSVSPGGSPEVASAPPAGAPRSRSFAARETYRLLVGLITPRPIAWVSTVSPGGVTNLAPFSFFNGVAANPPTLLFSVVNRRDGSKKDTVRNIEATGELVVNLVSHDLREAMNATSAELPYEESELELAGLTPLPSERVRPPRIKEAKVHMECVLHDIVRVGEGPLSANVILARILLVHLDDDVVDANGRIDPRRLDTIGRMGNDTYVRTTDLFDMPRPASPAAASPGPPASPPGAAPKTRR
jgi:flavin reductase (DIM6/NTAB) family NADH-FMN oxidoreductase RutF